MTPIHPSLVDSAKVILESEPSLTQNQRADLWDAWHSSPTVSSLARKLASMEFEIPASTEQALLEAKKLTTVSHDPVDRTVSAINRLAKLDPQVLSLIERFPHVLKHVTDTLED